MNKKLKNVLAVTGAIAVAAAAVYGLNAMDEKKDRKRYAQSGRLVEVRGKKMHIYSCGSGANTLVMIPGHGTPTPSLDFKPLMSRLADSYKIVVPEPFGYGYSDKTAEPRTVQNMVDEMREGLRKAGFFPPYVLTAHAMGGIATLYWAAHYPREVAAVVGLDTTLPAQGSSLAVTGMARSLMRVKTFLSKITPMRFLVKAGLMDAGIKAYNGGQEDMMPVVRSHAANMKTSGTIDNELLAVADNCDEVAGLNYPASCPVLMMVASESCELVKNDAKLGFDWMAEHEKITMYAHKGKCVLLQGGHYLHHTAADAITAEILDFVPVDEELQPQLRSILNK